MGYVPGCVANYGDVLCSKTLLRSKPKGNEREIA